MPDPESAGGDEQAQSPTSVDPAELATWLRRGGSFTLLDVRNREEFDEWHIGGPNVGAVQTAHQRFIAARVQETTEELVPDGPEPIVAVCGVGEASAEVAEQLRATGVDARNLAGGMEAWARQYDSVQLPVSDGTVLQYRRPSSGCLAYLVVGETTDGERDAAVIDPLRAFAGRYAEDAAAIGATLRYAVDTHVHADHVSGVRAVANETGAEVVLPAGVSERGLDYGGYEPDFVEAGDQLALGEATLEALALPGHTPEMTGFRLADDEHGDLLFGGDTLFLRSVARPDLAAGDETEVASLAGTLHETLAKLLSLPDETRLAPGHVGESTEPSADGYYVATLSGLRERLDLLDLSESVFIDRVTESLPERPANDAEIRAVNLGKRVAETPFELELGPNNCAAE